MLDLASAGVAALPAPLDRWSAELLGEPPQAERHATCERCAMCSHGDGDDDSPAAPPRRITFSPRTRCCTYRPQIANHRAGALLTEPGLRLQAERRLDAGEATPLGLRVDPTQQLLYRHAMAQAFGRAEALRCPHQQDDGGCGIWQHRPAVCATWFCKHERGAVGALAWTALRDCLMAAERLLALWCLEQLGFTGAARRAAVAAYETDRLDAASIDRRGHDDGGGAALWGGWEGRALELYRACHELVQPLRWSAVERIGGSELVTLAAAAREAARAHRDLSLPARLSAGSFQVIGAAAGRLWVGSYSEFDPIELSAELLQLLARCDGRPTATISAEHAAATGRAPPRRTLRTLLDFGVVEAAPDAN